MTWHRPPGARMRGIASGISSNRVGPSSNASYRASASSSSASASRSAWLRRPRIGGATAPTWRGDQAQTSCVECLAERHRWRLVAVPACLDDARLERGTVQREAQAGFAGRGMHDQFLLWRRRVRRGEAAAEPPRQSFARRIDVHHRHLRARNACQQRCGQQADHAGADHQHALAGQRRRIPCQIERRLHVGSQHRALRRHGVGHRNAHRGGSAGKHPGADAARRRVAHRACGRPRCSRTSPGTGTRHPSAARASPGAGSPERGRRTPAPRCRATRRSPACGPARALRRGRRSETVSPRISPRPGATVQKARASVMPAYRGVRATAGYRPAGHRRTDAPTSRSAARRSVLPFRPA